MNALRKHALVCQNEVTKRSLKGVWKNIWPDLSKSKDIEHSVDMDEIVELVKQTGLGEVNVEDIKKQFKKLPLVFLMMISRN